MTEKIPATELADRWKGTAEKLLKEYEKLSSKYVDHVKRLEEEKTQLALKGKITDRGDTVSKKDIQKIANGMLDLVNSYGSELNTAREKAQFLQKLAQEGDYEDLATLSLAEIKNASAKRVKEQTKKKLTEKSQELFNKLEKLEKESAPVFEPSMSEIQKRNNAQKAIVERFQDKNGDELMEDLRTILTDETAGDALKKEAFQIASSRFKGNGYNGLAEEAEALRREHIFSEEERQKWEKWQAIKNNTKPLLKSFKNHLVNKVDELEKAKNREPEDVAEELDNEIRPLLDNAFEKMDKSKELN